MAGFGGVVILMSFLIIIFSPVLEEVKDQVFVEDGLPGFTLLQAIKDEGKGQLQNNTIIEEFQELVGNVTDEMRENITTKINQTFSDV